MNKQKKISVVINTYNAERHLAEVLESVKDFDEVVVCDMESTDATRGIAEKYGCRIVTFPKGDITIAEPARNFAIQQATSEWVLVVDADEVITPELRNYLYHRITQTECPAGLYISRLNKFLGKYYMDWSHDYQLRFFMRQKTFWPPYVHSMPEVDGTVERAPLKYKMLHLADETMWDWIQKINRYTDNEIYRKYKKKYGVASLLWRPIWRFGRTYILQGGFLMGRRGLINAYLSAFYQVTLLSKIAEKDLRNKGQ